MFASVHNFNVPINFAVIACQCLETKYTIKFFFCVNTKIIHGKKEHHVTPVCVFPPRLNAECDWMNTFAELNVKICEKSADVRIVATLQAKRSIKLLVVVLINRIHIYVFDWASIRHHLKHSQTTNVIQHYASSSSFTLQTCAIWMYCRYGSELTA